jgi:hypothetical protein
MPARTNEAVCVRCTVHRMYLHTATSHGLTANNVLELAEGMPQKTIYDSYVCQR